MLGLNNADDFEGVFVQKIGSDQLPLHNGESGMRGKGAFHFVGTRLEGRQQIAVAALEMIEDFGQLV